MMNDIRNQENWIRRRRDIFTAEVHRTYASQHHNIVEANASRDGILTPSTAKSMMVEGQAVAGAPGAKSAMSVDKRISGAAAVSAYKTSMPG